MSRGPTLREEFILAPGQTRRLGALLRPVVALDHELVVVQDLPSGTVTVLVRAHDGAVRAGVTYDRGTVEILGAFWAERAAADVQERLR